MTSLDARVTAGADPVPFRQSWKACALLIIASIALALAIQLPSFLHQDVAWLTWVADKVMHGAVFGHDIYEVNPPLSFMIYVPAALLSQVMAMDLAIKLWTVFVAGLSMALVWQTAEQPLRLPVVAMLGLYFALVFPREFGQREQLALLLTTPYVAGSSSRRGVAVLSGLMAGIGFAMKPYFLVPLIFVFATRRRIRTEEWMIAATGLVYAVSVLAFFQPYLTEMVPRGAASYWNYNANSLKVILLLLMLVPAMIGGVWFIAIPQKGTAGYAAAALGFVIAVLMQRKGFPYHFLPCFGFLSLYLAAQTVNQRRLARAVAPLFLVLVMLRLSNFAVPWFLDVEGRRPVIPALLKEIDSAKSFSVLTTANYPSFPTAILTRTPFLGMSPLNNALGPMSLAEAGLATGDVATLGQMAIAQAVAELAQKPDLVIVDSRWRGTAWFKTGFDGLAWLEKDPAFHALWQDYRLTGSFGGYQFYRRK